MVGPESWTFYSEPYYGGNVEVTLSPGRYDGRWVAEHVEKIVSVKSKLLYIRTLNCLIANPYLILVYMSTFSE